MDLKNVSIYDLGIIWSLGSYVEERRFSFRHKEKYFLECLNKYFNNTIYEQERKGESSGRQFVLKVTGLNMDQLYEMGWTERNSDIRNIPELVDSKGFLRAYIEIHSALDYSTRHKRDSSKYKSLRLRIYGNVALVEDINNILNKNASVGIKKVQNLKNKKTSILNYTSLEEIRKIYDYLCGEPCFDLFWDDFRYKLENPTKEFILAY